MSVVIRITIEDVKEMHDFKDVDLNQYIWYFAKQIDVKADKEAMIAGWYVLGFDREKNHHPSQ